MKSSQKTSLAVIVGGALTCVAMHKLNLPTDQIGMAAFGTILTVPVIHALDKAQHIFEDINFEEAGVTRGSVQIAVQKLKEYLPAQGIEMELGEINNLAIRYYNHRDWPLSAEAARQKKKTTAKVFGFDDTASFLSMCGDYKRRFTNGVGEGYDAVIAKLTRTPQPTSES